MQTITLDKLQANLLDIFNLIQSQNKEFIVKNDNYKIAKIIPIKEKNKKRKFGQLKGKIKIPNDFNKEDKQINNIFYMGEVFPRWIL